MYWRTKDGKLNNPEDLAVVLAMDHLIVALFSEEYSTEHRMRDTAIEYGLEITKQQLELEEIVAIQMKKRDVPLTTKYRLFGLWLMGAVKLNGKELNIKKELEEDEELEEKEVPLPLEKPEVVEKKRREYTR